MDETGQTGDAGESAVCLFPAENRQAKRFLEAEAELEHVKGVKVEAAAPERLVVRNVIRPEDVESEKVGDEVLQLR